MNKLTIRSLVDDNPEIVETYECEHKVKDGKRMIAFDQPIYTSTARTVVTAEKGRAILLRNTAIPTRLEFVENESVFGTYFTGIGEQRVKVSTSKVSIDVSDNITKIRIHYKLLGLAENETTVKMNMTIED